MERLKADYQSGEEQEGIRQKENPKAYAKSRMIFRKTGLFTLSMIKVLRAEEAWQRAGAYSVRVQGMNRQYHISLQDEFDEHDGDSSKYIVLLDDGYPVATCRFYELEEHSVLLGRVVVLPEYRGQHLGSMVIEEAEKWINELGYREIRIDSRVEAIGFYEKLGYICIDDKIIKSWNFDCKRMQKMIR